MTTPLSVTSSASGGASVLTVVGELDMVSLPAFKEAVGAVLPPARRLVLDLAGLSFCDSTGLSGLVWLRNRAAEHDCALTLCALRPRVAKVLELSGIDTLIAIRSSVAEAIRPGH